MEERDEALDFIYKGWREGRQQRRDVMNQRGADRIAARRQRMAGYGSPSMQMQTRNMRGPPSPSQSNVASSPPSSTPYVDPVQLYLEQQGLQQPQEQTSSTTTGNFTDDISTPDDESTPINEAAGSPPSLNQAFSNLGVAEHNPTGGANVGRHDYVNEGFPQRTSDITQNVPSPAEVQERTPNRDLGTRLPEGQDPFPTNFTNLSEEDRSQAIDMLGEKHNKLKEGTETYQQAVADGKITEEQAREGIENYTDHLFEGLPPSMKPQPKSNEQQHKEAFETAFEGMKNEATQTPTPKELVSQHVEDRKNKKLEEMEQRAANRANDESLPDDKRDVAKLRQQMIAAMKEGKSKEEIDAMVQGSNLVGGDININGEKVQLDEDGNYTSPDGSIKITGNKKETKTPKPDETVSQAAKDTIKPAKKKATEEGKEKVKRLGDTLAAFGMGFKDDQPEA